ncbi:uncharacterized protein METZ01_LOCUS309974 [marine metagenome]|uniref:Lipoprotein n=1 Tax=marine metagenome TaxID=408172 RepID=A0A382N8Q0_9ZZZZ
MKSYFIWLIIIGGILFFVGSCGEPEESGDTCTAATDTTASGSITVGSETLSGTYTGPCTTFLVELAAALGVLPSDTKSVRSSYVVTSSNSVSDESFYYSDTTCSTLSLSLKSLRSDVAVGVASGSNYKVTYKSIYLKEFVNSSAAEAFREKVYSDAGLSVDLTQGCVYEGSTSGTEYKDLWNVTSTTLKTGDYDEDTYPSSVEATEYTKQ